MKWDDMKSRVPGMDFIVPACQSFADVERARDQEARGYLARCIKFVAKIEPEDLPRAAITLKGDLKILAARRLEELS